MRLSNGLGAGLLPREVKVRCNPGLHTIAVNAKGQFVRRDHSRANLRRWRDFECIGGEPCRCNKVIRCFGLAVEWGGKYLAALPKPLRRAASELRRLRSLERPSWALRREEKLSCLNWWERPEGVQRLLDHFLHGPLGVPADVRPVVTYSPGHARYILALVSSGGTLLERWMVSNWTKEVHGAGLAVLQGALTLAIMDRRQRWRLPTMSGAFAVQVRPQVAPDGAVIFVDQLVRLRRRSGGFEGVPVRQRRRRG
jgi:hypothetical protein